MLYFAPKIDPKMENFLRLKRQHHYECEGTAQLLASKINQSVDGVERL